MALKPLKGVVPTLLGEVEREFTPRFDKGRGLFVITDDEDAIVASGRSLAEVEGSLREWSVRIRREAAAAQAPREPFLVVRHAEDLRYLRNSYGEQPPRHLIGFSADRCFRNPEGVLYRDESGDRVETPGRALVIPETEEANGLVADVYARLGVIRTMLEGVVEAKPREELPPAASLPALHGAVASRGALITPDIWAVPPVKPAAGPTPKGGTEVDKVRLTVLENATRVKKTFRVLLDAETGQFRIHHPEWFKIPGHSVGRTVNECKFAFTQRAEEHDFRCVLEGGRHLLRVRTLFDDRARDRMMRPFPDKDPAPDTVLALEYDHVWDYGGVLWEPAWPDYEDVADLARRGQVNHMRPRGRDAGEVFVDWSPEVEARLRGAEDGIAQINAMLFAAIQNGFRPPERPRYDALPSPEM